MSGRSSGRCLVVYRQASSSSCRPCLTPATVSVFVSVSSHQFRRLCLALSFIFRFICLSGPVCFSPSGRSYRLFLVMCPVAAALADDPSSSVIPAISGSVVLPLRPSSISVASFGLPSLSRFRPSSSCRCLASSPSGCRHCLPVRVCISISVSGHHCSAAYSSLLRFYRCSGASVPTPFGHSDCSSVALRPALFWPLLHLYWCRHSGCCRPLFRSYPAAHASLSSLSGACPSSPCGHHYLSGLRSPFLHLSISIGHHLFSHYSVVGCLAVAGSATLMTVRLFRPFRPPPFRPSSPLFGAIRYLFIGCRLCLQHFLLSTSGCL